MRRVAVAVFLSLVIGLAVLTAGMFAFVLFVSPGQCDDPSCLAVQTFSPGETVELAPTVEPGEPTETGVVEPPIVTDESPSPPASPAP